MTETELPLENRNESSIQKVQSVSHLSRKYMLLAILYVLLFGLAEYITFFLNNLAGLVFYFAILLSLIVIGTLIKNENHQNIWLALGLVPLIRVVSLVMPVPEISQIYWYILISIPTIIGIIFLMRTLKYSLDDVGLNLVDPTVQVFVVSIGFFLGAIAYFVMKPEPMVALFNLQSTLFPALVLLLATGFVEEIAFRGVIQRSAGVLGSWDWIYVSIIYAILQIGHGSFIFCLFAFLVSLFFGWIVKTTGSVIGVSISHGILNIGFYLVFAFVM
jgi:uncharacterized protein